MPQIRKSRSEVKAYVHRLLTKGYVEISNAQTPKGWVICLRAPQGFVLELVHTVNGWLKQEIQ